MSKNYTGGLNFTWPTKGDTNWDTNADTSLTTISAHGHTGSGDGNQISTTGLAADSVTGAKILLANNEALRARNASAVATNIFKYNASNILEVLVPTAFSSTETLTASGAVSTATALTILNGASLAMTLAAGISEGQTKIIVNIASTPATITPAATSSANTVTLTQNSAVCYQYISGEWRALPGPNGWVIDDKETLTGSGAISLTVSRTVLNGSSLAMTLADGVEGQMKSVVNINATSATVTPATAANNAVTLHQYEAVFYQYSGSAWRVLSPLSTTNIYGTATNDNAAAGKLGEYVSSSLARASATALTNVTPKTVTSITLTAGDWDISFTLAYLTSVNPTLTSLISCVATTTNSLTGSVPGDNRIEGLTAPTTTSDFGVSMASWRVSINASTTYYLVSQAAFSAGNISAYGRISARRAR